MPASSSNFMQRKCNGHTPHTNVLATGMLHLWLCSSIIICIGAAASTSAYTQSTGTVANNKSSTISSITLTLTTSDTSAPTTPTTGAPTTSNTSAPTTSNTSAPSTPNTSAPTTSNTSASTTSNTSAPTTPNTSAPTTSNTSAPTTSNTSAPTTSNTSAPTTPNTSAPTTSNTSAPITSNTSAPTTPNTSAPTTSNTSVLTTSNTSAPTTSNTSAPTTSNTSAPTTPNTSAPTTSNTSAPTTPNTSASTTSNTSAPITSNTSAPTTLNTSAPTTSNTSAPTTSNTSASTTPDTSAPTTPNTSAPRAESTTSHAGSNKPTAFPIPTETMDVTLKLQVKLDRAFNESLLQPGSDYYKALVQTVKDELTPTFNHSGFLNITVTSFWSGSVGVNFTSYYKNANINDLHNILLRRVSSNLLPEVLNVTFLEQSLNDSIYSELKDVCEQSNRCPRDYYCRVNRDLQQLQPICQHVCLQHECQNNGYCVGGTQNQPVCKCPEDDDFVYSGENCQMKVEKLSMSKNNIIGIAAGVGGGVILLLIIAIVVISLKQRRMRRSKEDNIIDNASEQSFQSFKGSEDATHQPVSNIGHGAAAGNIQSLYRLPEERAENPNFNPYLSLRSEPQQPAVRQRDFSQGYTSGERPRERSRNVPVKLKQFQERLPNYGEPVQIPRIIMDSYGSEYVTTDSKRTQSTVPKTTNARRENQHGIQSHSPARAQVYDYSNDMELTASRTVHPLSDTDLYDFTYENQTHNYARDRNNRHPFDFPNEDNAKQRNGIKDPYSARRPLV